MKIVFFDAHYFEREPLTQANQEFHFELKYLDTNLNEHTAVLAKSYEVVSAFVNDRLNEEVLAILKDGGTKLIALRSAGFNHVDLKAASKLGLKVVRVPEYSPYAVAEHAVALLLTLNRKIHKAYNRVKDNNFSLDGLVGFDVHGKTIGVIGTGRIGKVFSQIMLGFGCHILAFDKYPDLDFTQNINFKYSTLDEIFKKSDIVSLHIPLSKDTFHLLNEDRFQQMKKGSILINTSRGGLVDTRALIKSLKSCHLGGAGLDVYEEEEHFFFRDHSCEVMTDDVLARLMTFPNVILTSHQAFLTEEALRNIAHTTFYNISEFGKGNISNEVKYG